MLGVRLDGDVSTPVQSNLFPRARVRSDIQRHLSSRPRPSFDRSPLSLPAVSSCRAARCVPMFTVNIETRNFSMQLPTVLHHPFPNIRVYLACCVNWKVSGRFSTELPRFLFNMPNKVIARVYNDEGLYHSI